MSENSIELKTIRELLSMKFFIPSYQRGYRWTEQQVKDLLNDIWEFSQKDNKRNGEFYCLQPLVVRSREDVLLTQIKLANNIEEVKSLLKGSWEVIDGQQRLTTIFIMLFLLNAEGNKKYNLSYETRTDFTEFLGNIKDIDIESINRIEDANAMFKKIVGGEDVKEKKWDNIDFYHIFIAFVTIKEFLKDRPNFKESLLNSVKFIWYETEEADPIKVFTRLNIGKIALTNAELIKALFLNRSNFGNEFGDHLRLRQQEIASEWDNIEYTLQNDEFWLFLHENGYDRPTRIDFIFDLICEQTSLGKYDNIGTDEYKTFRYFYEYFKQNDEKIESCWSEVKKYFQTFQEWFNDLELYHYVGYLIEYNQSVAELVKTWKECSTKIEFIGKLQTSIKKTISNCNDLNKQYEIDGAPKKTTCRPLLLLHNIQTIINQSKDFTSKKEYELPVFYKFPFHLYKKENWDVEHIDSNTTNELEKEKDQKEWLKYASLDERLNDDIKRKIKVFLSGADDKPSFDNLFSDIEKDKCGDWDNPEHDKNKVWNFVLLDAGTNRGYGNAIFPAKRRCIIGKDQGKAYTIDDNLNPSLGIGAIAFIPPVTKNVFLKYYNTSNANFRVWDKNDAEAYKKNILDTLEEFGVTDSSNNKIEDKNEQQ